LSFTLYKFVSTRPYLYHLTSSRNLNGLAATRLIKCAATLLRESDNLGWLTTKRDRTLTVLAAGTTIDIRDQQPLYAGKTMFLDGWTLEDLIRSLNEHVFFWPGTANGPIDSGWRHYKRYEIEAPAIIRVPTSQVFECNGEKCPRFCKFNSGSPRTVNGRGSPRGPRTFIECHEAEFGPSNVVEVTYEQWAILPNAVEVSSTPRGPWRRL
jgi:hypothetical protein